MTYTSPSNMAGVDGDVSDPASLDPESLGFMCGIEVHQQLATGKLHSRQLGELYDVTIDSLPDTWQKIPRRLRATSGEGGIVDVAARFEAKRNRSFIYCQSPNSGLIELDEQPPLPHDENAVDIALTVSAMMDCKPVMLLQAMRKTVVDGSNTSGFQRTTLVATDGVLKTECGDVGIDVLCLEEDSARKLDAQQSSQGEVVTWNLDRLGIPLIEIATAPDITTPDHAQQTALALGRVLRDTRRVRRGLGSIRQDLNVSIMCGDRVEIKGCQDLSWIPKIIRLEMARQLHFFRLTNRLRTQFSLPLLSTDRRQVDEDISAQVSDLLPYSTADVSACFSNSTSKMVVEGLADNKVMLALPLSGFSGHIGCKELDNDGAQLPRLGRELAGAAKTAGVAGIFHSDELPAYGITQAEVDLVRNALKGTDAFVLCLAPDWQAELALEGVCMRARIAFERIPQEVRQVVVRKGAPEDGTTTPMRPLPGGARMYPETDISPLPLDIAHWQKVASSLPPSQEQRLNRLNDSELSSDQATQLLARELDDHFFAHANDLPHKAWASTLLEHNADIGLMALVIAAMEEGHVTREGVGKLLKALEGEVPSMSEIQAISEQLGLVPADASDLQEIIEKVVVERLDFIKERGLGAIGPLMGVVMGECGGAADGREVSALLKAAIERYS
jgi:glutamyl-tRNA(Gln) amidotransferase subunit E